jgi:cytochrome b
MARMPSSVRGDAHACPPLDAMGSEPVRVWDRFVRMFHWSLVACVLLNVALVDDGETLHRALGYVASGLVAARVVWGFIGPRPARFAAFWPTRARLVEHVRGLLAGQAPLHEGHNPLGALMMLTLMALVVALGVTGHLQTTDAFWGEAWLQEVHDGLATTLVAAAGVHAAAALVMGRLQKVRLVRAMVTGVKQRRP